MKNVIADRLYVGWVRNCIMDLYAEYSEDGKVISPRPDFIDYPVLLYILKNGKCVNLNDRKISYTYTGNTDLFENYDSQMVLSLEKLYSDDITYKKVSSKQALYDFRQYVLTKELVPIYGYKKYEDGKAKVKTLVRGNLEIYNADKKSVINSLNQIQSSRTHNL